MSNGICCKCGASITAGKYCSDCLKLSKYINNLHQRVKSGAHRKISDVSMLQSIIKPVLEKYSLSVYGIPAVYQPSHARKLNPGAAVLAQKDIRQSLSADADDLSNMQADNLSQDIMQILSCSDTINWRDAMPADMWSNLQSMLAKKPEELHGVLVVSGPTINVADDSNTAKNIVGTVISTSPMTTPPMQAGGAVGRQTSKSTGEQGISAVQLTEDEVDIYECILQTNEAWRFTTGQDLPAVVVRHLLDWCRQGTCSAQVDYLAKAYRAYCSVSILMDMCRDDCAAETVAFFRACKNAAVEISWSDAARFVSQKFTDERFPFVSEHNVLQYQKLVLGLIGSFFSLS